MRRIILITSVVFAFSVQPIAAIREQISSANTNDLHNNDGVINDPRPAATVNSYNLPVEAVNDRERQANIDTVNAVNRIPGVKLRSEDLQPLVDEPAIRGFHPIKKMLQPVERLEKNSVQLQQQIMKLEGPIAGLQPPMLGLQKKMTAVEQKMTTVQGRIDAIDSRVNHAGSQMDTISGQMMGVRADLSNMLGDINRLNGPLKDLHKPLVEVATPLKTVDEKIEKLTTLITAVLFTIVVAAVSITVGTPIAAVLIYKYRRKLFPDMPDNEFPVAKASEQHPSTGSA